MHRHQNNYNPNYTHFPQMFVDGRFIGSSDNIYTLCSEKSFK